MRLRVEALGSLGAPGPDFLPPGAPLQDGLQYQYKTPHPEHFPPWRLLGQISPSRRPPPGRPFLSIQNASSGAFPALAAPGPDSSLPAPPSRTAFLINTKRLIRSISCPGGSWARFLPPGAPLRDGLSHQYKTPHPEHFLPWRLWPEDVAKSLCDFPGRPDST